MWTLEFDSLIMVQLHYLLEDKRLNLSIISLFDENNKIIVSAPQGSPES